jgi:hypothetical protein
VRPPLRRTCQPRLPSLDGTRILLAFTPEWYAPAPPSAGAHVAWRAVYSGLEWKRIPVEMFCGDRRSYSLPRYFTIDFLTCCHFTTIPFPCALFCTHTAYLSCRHHLKVPNA